MDLLQRIVSISFCIFSSASFAIDGSYFVPIDSDRNTFSVSNIDFTEDHSGQAFLNYSLPEDLVGPNAPVLEFVADGGHDIYSFKQVNGNGHATCEKNSFQMNCNIDYVSQDYDTTERDNFLIGKFEHEPETLKEALRVASFFDGDPVGVLNFNLQLFE